MDNLVSGTNKRFRNLLDAIAAEPFNGMRPGKSGFAPSVGAAKEPSPPSVTVLGPSVGDDGQNVAPSDAISTMSLTNIGPSIVDLTMLGPSVGDDFNKRLLTALGPSVGDDNDVSDLRLKEEVQRVGTTVFGLPLYRFKYLGRPETYEGVMAQEVLQVMPDAVSRGADGYYRVNYSALGSSMKRVS